ncbi:MAG TPA: uracil-DNA glycosylase family protein [Candidatus Hydrogenedentes bacterium]|nr:uracil-DNA glycosylase family protein [Candidatus Hydrogenedentota bacterium]HRZ18120.1 uracil-DNA glycosylase family protein [Candidatus Hydrogenedentota bacterium]
MGIPLPFPLPALPEAPLDAALEAARACARCADRLPLGPRPVLRGRAGARLLIVGQAPGTRVHETGLPWNDASGERLRAWMGVDRDTFYDEDRVAVVPMGLCYPGRDPRGGDLPPVPECAPLWHPRLVPLFPGLELALLVGGHAQRYYLGGRAGASVTETVRSWRQVAPDFLPLPHPSFRNTAWLARNPWFAEEVLPALRARIRALL